MSPDRRRATGKRGEDLAADHLVQKGYQILHRNLQLSHLEIDLICRDRDCLVFVEVKTSRGEKYGHPATWIDNRKQERMRRAAQMYLEREKIKGLDIRFDAITILHGRIEHYPNAF